MNLTQTKLVGLTMELELKAREYQEICDKLDKIKANNVEPNDESLLEIKNLFKEKNEEIAEINRQISELKKVEEIKEQQKQEECNSENIFKSETKNTNMDIMPIEPKKNIFVRILQKIKAIFKIA